jgi:pimeloyl-ACP methyl ester carboxylesterase
MAVAPPLQRARAAMIGIAGAIVAAACGDGPAPQRGIALAECRLPHFAQPAQCATLQVPEDRAHPNGRRIDIFVGVLPANTLSPKPDPLFILAGGPGQAASHLAPFAAQHNAVRRTRDIVLVDQRGTGRSAPLECAAHKPDRRDLFVTDPLPKATACEAELQSRGVDAAHYTTSAFVADVDAVRAALGYERLNLWGGSYGSRVALEYLRRHPGRVRSVVLDSVAPPSMNIALDVWATRDEALDALLEACRRSAACAAAHPDPGATLAAIERDLGDEGKEVVLVDPRTGEATKAQATYDLVVAALGQLAYVPELSSLIPALLERARDGDYAPLFAALLVVAGNLVEQMNVALHYSVTCAEDVPRLTAAERARSLQGVRGRALASRIFGVCDVWPQGTMPADFADPVGSDVPVLLLSGGLDPVTPPDNAAQVAKTLPNSRHIVAAGSGHIVSPHGCAPRLIAAFIDAAGFETLPAECVEHLQKGVRPPFFAGRLAAQP